MNNYEKIKNMSIDAMAEEFYIHLGGCSACAMSLKCKNHHLEKHKCINMYKEWLESEEE